MNDNDTRPLDRRARRAHADALDALSPRTRAQLHNRLRSALASGDAPPRRDWRWVAAPALALALALSLPMTGEPPAGQVPVAAIAAGTLDAPAAPLEQDPEFYAWLGSDDALALASE